ncbi:hypothetical protein [Pseudoalteromonas luteoviolacea]|uniref:Uncharacterized protein n=1 Tax=Pseudoalteromonas luteoviolacea DSM 6061 TaxID=1365250 RepID=A0A166VTG1_9GAMM|nr:hypothetical protein [Pseudoalteromonas luteoviolacea]KZN33684.1 hypothetical protein N475_20130 [Pseudoalteromonas luteoviolacea DSM 6061]KZN53776.1 hypothetical protein N474_19590 [Pseudoalteromonas luteoviolacea CPMOR-2]TQF67763.1 hypothetical protein FLM44_21530 [Pseudoalteromonas luteoviolacea]
MTMFHICYPIEDCHWSPQDDLPVNSQRSTLCIVKTNRSKFKSKFDGQFRIFELPKEFAEQLHSFV